MTRNGTCVFMVLLPWIAADFAWSRASISPPHADSVCVCVCLSLWTRLSSTVTLLLTVEYLAWKHLCPGASRPTRTSASSLSLPPVPSARPPPPSCPGCSTFRTATPSGKPSLFSLLNCTSLTSCCVFAKQYH